MLHESDGVALVKGLRAAAPHACSGNRPQCSSCVLSGQKTLDAKSKGTCACEEWDNKACWQHALEKEKETLRELITCK